MRENNIPYPSQKIFSIDDARELAKWRLPRLVFDFVDGASGNEFLSINNNKAYENIKLEPRVLINPTIKEQSKIYKEYEEGCLSFPNHYFSVSRPESLLIDFIDLDGNKKEKLFSGFEAVCVQHEIDHLSGTLFTAYLSRLKRQIIVKKMQKFKKNLNKSI